MHPTALIALCEDKEFIFEGIDSLILIQGTLKNHVTNSHLNFVLA